MKLYFKHKKLGAIHAELSKKLGREPLFMIENCKGETILHCAYMEIILTSPAALRYESETTKHDDPNRQIVKYIEGAKKDRPRIPHTIRNLPTRDITG